MYSVAVARDFTARHFLVDASPEESREHAHSYRLELILEGDGLDDRGYLVDIDEVKSRLDAILDRYRGKLLNELAEFARLNPSLENFSRIVCFLFRAAEKSSRIATISVRIWEDDSAWAGYREGK